MSDVKLAITESCGTPVDMLCVGKTRSFEGSFCKAGWS